MTRTITTTNGGSIVSDISNLTVPFIFVLAQKSLEKQIGDKKSSKSIQSKDKKSNKSKSKSKNNTKSRK